MADSDRFGLDELLECFRELDDPRSEVNRKHPLASVVVMAVIAVLAGASGPTTIAERAAFKKDFLASVLPLPRGAPCKDVFRRVLMALRPEAFQECLAAWPRALRDRKNGPGALHPVTVRADDRRPPLLHRQPGGGAGREGVRPRPRGPRGSLENPPAPSD